MNGMLGPNPNPRLPHHAVVCVCLERRKNKTTHYEWTGFTTNQAEGMAQTHTNSHDQAQLEEELLKHKKPSATEVTDRFLHCETHRETHLE